jgi:TonB family protein
VNDSAPPAAAPVTTLPETLTITVANRKSQAWPHIVSSPPLQYPDKAKQESLQGLVWVRALVDPAGRVLETSIERGIAELNDAALAWVRGSQFTACEKNGAPCRYVVRVAVLFTLY